MPAAQCDQRANLYADRSPNPYGRERFWLCWPLYADRPALGAYGYVVDAPAASAEEHLPHRLSGDLHQLSAVLSAEGL